MKSAIIGILVSPLLDGPAKRRSVDQHRPRAPLLSRPSLWTRRAPELFSWALSQAAFENPLMVELPGPP